LKTGRWPDSRIFPKAIPVIAREVPPWLQARGVKLLGLDLPSVDEIEAKNLVNHHSLGAAGISILESLDLSAVAAGRYQFAGLPLKIAGADGAPVRAILWQD
jgi:arylformamidase